jgi:predicted aspartyl protease
MSRIASQIIAFAISLGALLLFSSASVMAASANPVFDRAMELYNRKDYRAAAQQFELAMRASPGDPEVIYYCALCAEMSNNRPRARQLLEHLTRHFPQARVAPMAQFALSQLSGGSPAQGQTVKVADKTDESKPAESASPDLAGAPDLVRIPYEKQGDAIKVMVRVNGRSVPFVLNTGANDVTIGANQIEDWGISQGRQAAADGKAQNRTQKLDLTLGGIYRREFPVQVVDNLTTDPSLGQSFLRDFYLTIDDASNTILLAKKGGRASNDILHKSYRAIEIPFTRGSGGQMMVNTVVNGRPLPMAFDTSCAKTTIRLDDWTKIGFDIPLVSKKALTQGPLGPTIQYRLDSLILKGKTKSIEQNDTPVTITPNTHLSLLGMTFYGSYRYTIDTVRSVIIFE